MIIERREVRLKDQSICILRNPQEKDAEKMIRFFVDVTRESDFLLKSSEEVNTSLEYEAKRIDWMNRSDKELILLAERNKMIIGVLMIGAVGNKIKVKHRCSLVVAVKEKHRCFGVGNTLLIHALKYVKAVGFQFAELEVISRNYPAIRLYLKNGFQVIGERPCGVIYRDGTYDNCLIMCRRL